MSYISMGGGLGIPYKDEESSLDFDQVFRNVAHIFNRHFEWRNIEKPELWIEPGKSVVGDAGILLARVTGIKKSYKTFLGLDAGMETLMRLALYGTYGYSMSHNFNTRPRAAEVLLDGDAIQLIRKRETIEDIFRKCEL